MNIETLKVINEQLKKSEIPYRFQHYGTNEIPSEYWVGSYSEVVNSNGDDGETQSTFILTGTTTEDWLTLEKTKEKIKQLFPACGGFRTKTDKGTAVIMYDNSIPIPVDSGNFKRMQINLSVYEWEA